MITVNRTILAIGLVMMGVVACHPTPAHAADPVTIEVYGPNGGMILCDKHDDGTVICY